MKVSSKSAVRNFTKKKGMLFDFCVLDTGGSIMQVVCFNSIVNKFYDITVHKVYLISNGHVKNNNNSSNTNFSSVFNECQYKLILNDESTVTEAANAQDIERFPSLSSLSTPESKLISFTSIDDILYAQHRRRHSAQHVRRSEIVMKYNASSNEAR